MAPVEQARQRIAEGGNTGFLADACPCQNGNTSGLLQQIGGDAVDKVEIAAVLVCLQVQHAGHQRVVMHVGAGLVPGISALRSAERAAPPFPPPRAAV